MAEVKLEIIADASGSVRELRSVAGETDKLGKKSGRLKGQLGALKTGFGSAAEGAVGLRLGAVGLAGAAGAVGLAVGGSVKHVVDLGNELTTLRDRTGIGLDGLQEMKFIADQTGVAFNSVSDSSVRLGRRVAAGVPEATKALSALGLGVDEILAANPEDAFFKVVEQISRIPDPANQSAAAMAIFGDAGLGILPLIRSDVESTRESFQEMGGAIRGDVLEAGRELSDNLTNLKASLLGNVVDPITGAVIPILNAGVEGILNWKTGIQETGLLISLFAADAADDFSSVVEDLAVFTDVLALLPGETGAAFTGVSDSIRNQAIEMRENARVAKEEYGAAIAGLLVSEQDLKTKTDEASTSIDGFSLTTDKAGKATKSLADGLGVGGLLGQSEALQTAIVELNARGEELSQAGLARVAKVVDELRINGLPVPPLLAEMAMKARDLTVSLDGLKVPLDESVDIIADANEQFPVFADSIPPATAGVGDLKDSTISLGDQMSNANDVLSETRGLMNLFGVEADSTAAKIISRFSAVFDTMNGVLSIVEKVGGGFGKLGTASGDGGFLGSLVGGGGFGGLPGVGLIAGLGGALFGGIASLFDSGPDLVRDAARDLGATIPQEMADELVRSGRPLELAISDIFRAGGFESLDRFAEETGDIFSGLQQGKFSKPEAIAALEEAVPILLDNLEELGPAGEEQIQRIIAAASQMGITFEGLDGLVESVTGNLENAFAPQTMESIAEQFGITNQEVRDLAETLGIDVQTNLERMAESAGLSVEEFKALGDAVKEKFGIPIEEIGPLLEALGTDAASLAESLGIDVGDGASGLDDAIEGSNEKLQEGVDNAAALADELERARDAALGIGFGAGLGLPGGAPSLSVNPMMEGGFGETTRPTLFMSSERGQREGFAFFPGGLPAGGGAGAGGAQTINVSIAPTINLAAGTPHEQVREIMRLFDQNIDGFATRLKAKIRDR